MWHAWEHEGCIQGFYWKLRITTWKTQEASIKIEFQEIGLGNVNCVDLAQVWDRWHATVKKVTNIWVP